MVSNVAGQLHDRVLSYDAYLMLSIRGLPAHCRTVVLNHFDSQDISIPQLSTTIFSCISSYLVISESKTIIYLFFLFFTMFLFLQFLLNHYFRAWHNKSRPIFVIKLATAEMSIVWILGLQRHTKKTFVGKKIII